MIDTHSHIYAPEFDDDRDDVIARARQAGISRILLPNINEDTIKPMLQLAEAYKGYCFPMMGLHPEDVRDDYTDVLSRMREMLANDRQSYVAIGEVGLDFYWDETYREQQIAAFRHQIEWAVELSMPLVIHVRKAHREVVDILRTFDADKLTGIFHCFGGTREEAAELLSFQGFCLGIGGVLTYKKSALPDALADVPLGRIVLETDAPYLAPVPHRGKRNESAYVADTMRCLAQLKRVAESDVERTTDANVARLFPKIFT